MEPNQHPCHEVRQVQRVDTQAQCSRLLSRVADALSDIASKLPQHDHSELNEALQKSIEMLTSMKAEMGKSATPNELMGFQQEINTLLSNKSGQHETLWDALAVALKEAECGRRQAMPLRGAKMRLGTRNLMLPADVAASIQQSVNDVQSDLRALSSKMRMLAEEKSAERSR
jgi:hypothetical protein